MHIYNEYPQRETVLAKAASGKERRSWEVDFVICSLNEEDRKALKKYDITGVESMDQVEAWVSDGYKLSINRDEVHDCVGVWVTEPEATRGTRRKCLSARGPDVLSSLRACVYKHRVLLGGDWGVGNNPEPFADGWG